MALGRPGQDVRAPGAVAGHTTAPGRPCLALACSRTRSARSPGSLQVMDTSAERRRLPTDPRDVFEAYRQREATPSLDMSSLSLPLGKTYEEMLKFTLMPRQACFAFVGQAFLCLGSRPAYARC